MSKRETFARYGLIINRLRRRPSTLKEIMDYLALESEIHGDDYNISSRTFQRDVKEILSLFHIDIVYDFSRKVYYIEQDNTDAQNHILETFDMLNALQLTERLSEYIHFERHRPRGTEFMYELLQAIRKRHKVQFDYKKFWENSGSERIGAPLALKEFENRWYLIFQDDKDMRIKTFALDRMSNLKPTNLPFIYPQDFDIRAYFQHAYGIIRPDNLEPMEVILSFQPFQGKYIKTLPLHESQKILADNSKELRIQLHLILTEDFIMKLLSYGKKVQVISPQVLQQKMDAF